MTWSKLSRVLKNSYVVTAILIIIVLGGIFAFFLGLRAALGTEYPLRAVVSTSMLPTLDVSDIIVIQGTKASEIKAGPELEGDIIVFHSPYDADTFIVHRAVNKVFNDGVWYFQTRGDNRATNSGADTWYGSGTWNGMISEKLVVGKVVGIIPWIGNLSLFIRTPQGMILIIFLFIIVLFIEYVPVILKKTLD